jgi:predicted PurR-regulated permease PerM
MLSERGLHPHHQALTFGKKSLTDRGSGNLPRMYSPFYSRAFAIATFLVVGYLLLEVLRPLAGPLGWAAVLAFLLNPVQERLARRLKGRSSLAAGILTGLTPFCVMAPLAFVGVVFARQVAAMIDRLRGHSMVSYPTVLEHLESYPVIGSAVRWIRDNSSISADQVQGWITDAIQSLLKSVATMSGTFALGVVGSLVGFFLMLFLLFFLLRDGRMMLGRLTRLIPMEPAKREELLGYLANVTLAVVFGSVATALVQGTLAGAGFALVGLPSPVVFAVLATIAAFLPVGSAIVLVPAVLYLMIAGRWGAAIFLAIWSAAVGVADNFLRPYLTSQRAEVSTLAVFIGAIGGASAFGILGLVIGPVLLGFVVALVQFAEEAVTGRRAARRKAAG